MQMNRLHETASTLVYDPVGPNRIATRASLHSVGFRRVELAPTLDVLRDRLKLRWPDLLLVEVAGSENEVCELVQQVRQGTLGDNPFIVIIVTTWRRDGSIVGQVLNSGADDLIARPVSAHMLGERVKAFAERRKKFVVTMDYIGPDRRREPRGKGAECVDVPNPLNIRSTPNLSEESGDRQIAAAIRRGKESLDIQKTRRDAVQLCLQWRMLEQRVPGARDFREILPRINRLAFGIKQRVGDAEAREYCNAVGQSVDGLIVLVDKAARDGSAIDCRPALHGLGQAAMALGRMFAPDEVEPGRLVELDMIMASRHAPPEAA
jgi:response regulator RpfG family c-di-GMP phosphodiesterase